MNKWRTHHGMNQEILKGMDPESIDAVVTDPPYGLSDHSPKDIRKALVTWSEGRPYTLDKGGIMGATWDSFVPGPECWREVFRVMKPGGYLLAFASTRTLDLMSLAIRISGFELRDTVVCDGVLRWAFAQGFPKNVNLSKEIDAQIHTVQQWQKVRDHLVHWKTQRGMTNAQIHEALGLSTTGSGMLGHWLFDGDQRTTPSVEQWANLKSVLQWPDCELDEEYGLIKSGADRPVVGERTLPRGSNLFNRGGEASERKYTQVKITAAATPEAQQWEGWGTALKPSWEPVLVFRKPPSEVTLAQNVIRWGTGGLNIDESRVPCFGGTPPTSDIPNQRGLPFRCWMEMHRTEDIQ